MPTPERVKLASLEKRKRICTICEAHFIVRSVDRKGVACSKDCLRKSMALRQKGHKQSPETIAKRSQAMKAVRADPERRAAWHAATAAAIKKWHTDPANAAAFAKRSSERMKRRHTDPDFQKRRDERSSRVMSANWQRHRESFIQQSIDRYERMASEGTGLLSEEAKAKKAVANKWILKQAQAALHTETDYDVTYTEVQARLRMERPYDGPQEGSDYLEYLQWLGRSVVNSPECRAIADDFLSRAIPHFAAEWNTRKKQAA